MTDRRCPSAMIGRIDVSRRRRRRRQKEGRQENKRRKKTDEQAVEATEQQRQQQLDFLLQPDMRANIELVWRRGRPTTAPRSCFVLFCLFFDEAPNCFLRSFDRLFFRSRSQKQSRRGDKLRCLRCRCSSIPSSSLFFVSVKRGILQSDERMRWNRKSGAKLGAQI